jgi:hypothetical protein
MLGDQRAAGGGFALAAINLFGATAMLAVAAFLFEPSIIDIGVYIERGKYALLGYTLTYAGTLVLIAIAGGVRTGRAFVNYAASLAVGSIALLALGLLFAALAADALFYREPANVWVGLLALASVVCFSASFAGEVAERQVQAATPVAARGFFGTFLTTGALLTAALAAAMVYVNAGVFLFYVLQANVLEGVDIDFGRFAAGVIIVVRDVIAERGPLAVILGLLGAFAISLFAGLAALGERASQRAAPPAKLSEDDTAFITRSATELWAYAEARGYGGHAKSLLWLVTLPSLLAPAILGSIIGLNLHNWVPRPYTPEALHVLGWHVYEREVGFASIAMIFAGIFWGALPNAILARLSRAYSEMVGWSGFANGQTAIEPYLATFLRSGFLSRDKAFDPGAFLHRLNTMYEPYMLFPAVFLSLAAAVAWHHDMSRYHVLSGRYVEVMNYWTLEKHRYPYASVQGVKLGCTYDDGRAVASYEIALPDGFSINLLWRHADERLDDLARVDGLMPPAVPRTFRTTQPLFREARSGFDPVCLEELAGGLPEAEGERLRAIFRVEEWHKARWLERTTAPK